MAEEHDPDYEARMERAKVAEMAMVAGQAQLSEHRFQPRFLWTRRRFSEVELKIAVEADGAAPFRLLFGWEDRRGLQAPGCPHWAKVCYVIVVEVLARNV